eukprot:1534590-Prorocentrum_lima.AAC.1
MGRSARTPQCTHRRDNATRDAYAQSYSNRWKHLGQRQQQQQRRRSEERDTTRKREGGQRERQQH